MFKYALSAAIIFAAACQPGYITTGVDADNDGYASVESGGDDCDDADVGINPGADDVQNDGVDQDCTGSDWTTGEADADTDADTDSDTDADSDTDSDTDTDPGQDDYRTLTIKVYSPDGDEIPGLMFNSCYGPEVEDPTDCDAWQEPGQVVNWEPYIQWSSDVITTGLLRFNVSYYFDARDVQDDGSLEDDDSWFCYGSTNPQLTASYEVWFDGDYYDTASGIIDTVSYGGGCSAYLDIDLLALEP